MTLKNDGKSEEELNLSFQNWHKEFDKFWLKNSKVWKVHTLMGCFWAKYIMVKLKKYRGVIFDKTRVWCKIWRKTDLWFGKWLEEFGMFSPEHPKVSKLGLSLDAFTQSKKFMKLKLTGDLFVMKMKNDSKFEKKRICPFKVNIRNLTNFDPSAQKSQKFAL